MFFDIVLLLEKGGRWLQDGHLDPEVAVLQLIPHMEANPW